MSRSGAAYLLAGSMVGSQMTAGAYYSTGVPTRLTTVLADGLMNTSGLYLPRQVTIDRIGLEVTGAGGAGSVIRLGIHADSGAVAPGSLLLDAGTIDGTSVTAQQITVSVVAGPGLVWLTACAQGTPVGDPTVRSRTGGAYQTPATTTSFATATGAQLNGRTRAGIPGALPNPYGSDSNNNTSAIVVVRVQ